MLYKKFGKIKLDLAISRLDLVRFPPDPTRSQLDLV